MSYQNIAFIGKARSGKDTAGARLVDQWAFTRMAFADPLKHMALEINPWVKTGNGVAVRFERLIADAGWDYAKEIYPDVRQYLQRMGQTVRELDQDFWVRTLMDKVKAAEGWNMPVVVTDCRYRNEAEALRAAGFRLVRVKRPGLMSRDQHPSETELDSFSADVTLINGGSVFDLHTSTDALVRSR